MSPSRPPLMTALLVVAATATACGFEAPDCPWQSDAARAPSAGCFATESGALLVVQGLNGKISLPGGSSERGESAMCTAFRETWEESGLKLAPRERLAVFETGFYLYRCDRDDRSGEINPPAWRREVLEAFYLQADEFTEYEWRFPEQVPLLRELVASER